MSTVIIGGGSVQPGVEQAVDPKFSAAHVALYPLDYTNLGIKLGHFRVCQKSGATVSIGAGGILGSIRNPDTSKYLVLLRIRAGFNVTAAITAATPMDLKAIVARGFSVDFTTASTAANLVVPANTGKVRSSMGASILGIAGPRIATTTVMSGQTLTADADAFASLVWPSIVATNATGTVVTQSIGVGGPMLDLYKVDVAAGEHPIVLAGNEGVLIETFTAGPVTGTVAYYFEWTWAEVALY